MGKSKIEWTEETWNPVTGCTKISPGCKNCYAERMAKRLGGRFGYPAPPYHFDVTLHYDRLNDPLGWKKPRMIFVCSMGDLFHEDIPTSFIQSVFQVMHRAHWHTFQVLTKRAWRMDDLSVVLSWPENVWAGITVENQRAADVRIPYLLRVPAAVRFLSCEPLLEPLNLSGYLRPVPNCQYIDTDDGTCTYPGKVTPECHAGVACPLTDTDTWGGPNWVNVGGESGPGARPMHPDWVRSIRDQCLSAGVPFFFKQWGAYRPAEMVVDGRPEVQFLKVGKKKAGRLLDGREWNEFPPGRSNTKERKA